MTTNINDNVVQVKFNTPIETDYVVITSLQFPKFETWGWPSVTEMVYNKTSTGFTMDVWNSHQEYQHVQCTINWIAIPLQHSVSPTGFTCLQGSIESGTYCAYARIGHLIFVCMNDMPSMGTKGTLPEGYRPPTDIIGFGYVRGTNTSGQILVNSAGKVATWCNQNNTRYFSGSVCFVVEQHSVSQHEDWVAARFKFGVDKITFWQNANGNFEIWFNTSKDNICLTFSRDMVGVYDANTRTGKSVHLSQHSVSLTEDTCKGANGWVVQTGAITRTENCVTMWVDVVAGTGANKNVNVTFATMPPAFAPKTYDIELPVLGFTTTSYPISFWIRITTSGEIKIKQYVLPANTVLGQIKCCCTYLKI